MNRRALLLSLRPQHWNSILDHGKQFEYRRVSVNIRQGDLVFVYVSQNPKAICGSFVAGKVIKGHPSRLSLLDKGENREAALKYLEGACKATAIEVKYLKVLRQPIKLSSIGLSRAPQSYCFMESSLFERVCDLFREAE